MAGRKKKEKEPIVEKAGLFDVGSEIAPVLKDKGYLTVSEFLDGLNAELRETGQFVAGEVTEFRAHEKWLSFSLKDKDDGSIMRCFLSIWTYRKIGVELADGMEIKVGGYPRVYKPAGTFSFNVETIEPLGEGSLKKAYDLLLKKLKEEGLFERKRPMPKFIKNIGVISSKNGVVIHDFLKNLKLLGFNVKLFDSRVEGADAVEQLTSALRWFGANSEGFDILVIMRGGGSLESMQAFNNEAVCREIFASKIPVLCGIGHEVDVPIACLVADEYVSTPTATAFRVNQSWDELLLGVPMLARSVVSGFERIFREKVTAVPAIEKEIIMRFSYILAETKKNASGVSGRIFAGFKQVFYRFGLLSDRILKDGFYKIGRVIVTTKEEVSRFEKLLSVVSPERNLRLGYSIVFNKEGRVVKGVGDIKEGDVIKTKFGDGEAESEVRSIKN